MPTPTISKHVYINNLSYYRQAWRLPVHKYGVCRYETQSSLNRKFIGPSIGRLTIAQEQALVRLGTHLHLCDFEGLMYSLSPGLNSLCLQLPAGKCDTIMLAALPYATSLLNLLG